MKILNICRRSSREPAPSSFSFSSISSEPLPGSEPKFESKKRETKKGRMERTSTMLSESVRKAHFWGAPANLLLLL